MSKTTSSFQERIASGGRLLVAEISPPQGADPAPLRAAAKRFAGKVHALGISDNREMVRMAALAAAAVVAGEGVEPILHVTTRDRNRIALVSEVLGAQALGIRNVLCTSGSHQTLGRFRAAKNVYDVDAVQLVQAYAQLATDASLASEKAIAGAGPFCLGAVASPDADPLALQVSRLAKKVTAGAAFLITQPIYDLERFHAWWKAVTERGLHEKVAILAGIEALPEEELAKATEAGKGDSPHLCEAPSGPFRQMGTVPFSGRAKRTLSKIPQSTLHRVGSAGNPTARRSAAIEIALEIVQQLATVPGLRGFGVACDGDSDAALEILDRSGLGSN